MHYLDSQMQQFNIKQACLPTLASLVAAKAVDQQLIQLNSAVHCKYITFAYLGII